MYERGKILAIKVLGINKKKEGTTRHQEYMLNVEWSDGAELLIFRRYTMFFGFQAALKDLFQEKSGIPNLPVPKFLHASRKLLGIQRRDCKPIEEFCQKIIQLPPNISESEIVLRFFDQLGTDAARQEADKTEQVNLQIAETDEEQHDVDTNTEETTGNTDEPESPTNIDCYRSIADFEGQNPGELSLISGEIVTVIERNDTGWWFVTNYERRQGYAPATFLESLNPAEQDSEEDWTDVDSQKGLHIAVEGYEAQSLDEVSYKAGDQVEVLSMSNFGWWKVRFNGKVGFSPCTNLRPKEEVQQPVKCSIKDKCLELTNSPIYSGLNSIYATYAVVRAPPRRSSKEFRESTVVDHQYGVLENDVNTPNNNAVIYAEIDCNGASDEPSEGLYAEPTEELERYKSSNESRIYDEVHDDNVPSNESSNQTVIYDEVRRDNVPSNERLGDPKPPPSYAKVIPKNLRIKKEVSEEKPEKHKSDSDDSDSDGNMVPVSRIKKIAVPSPRIHKSQVPSPHMHKSHSTDEILKNSSKPTNLYINLPVYKDQVVHDYVNLHFADEKDQASSSINDTVVHYKAIANYESRGENEDFVIKEGDVVELLAVDGSWWQVAVCQDGDSEAATGWVPSLYLKKITDDTKSPNHELELPHRNRRSRSEGNLPSPKLPQSSSTLPSSPQQLIRMKSQSDPEPQQLVAQRRMQEIPDTRPGTMTLPSHTTRTAGKLVSDEEKCIGPLSPTDYKQQVWFHGVMNRHKCEQLLLECGGQRDFLIRESVQRVGSYVISVRFHARVRHFPTEKTSNGKLIVGKNTFHNLIEVVEFYKKNALFYTENREEVMIANPLPRKNSY